MRRPTAIGAPSKTAATLAAVFTLGLASCGGDEEPSTGSSSVAQGQQSAQSAEPNSKGNESSEQGVGAKGGPDDSTGAPKNDTSQGFTPRRHSDSGGGSEQFVIPGADNSVQEFGTEAEDQDFEQAATALHTFYDARAARAWRVACEQLTAGLVASLEGRGSPDAEPQMSCARGLAASTNTEALPQLRREARDIDVGSFRAEADAGFLLYTTEGVPHAIAAVSESGEWKLANLAGYPLDAEPYVAAG